MTIKELQSIIGGEVTMMFNYNVNQYNEFYELMLDIESLTPGRVRVINNNGFVAEVRNMYDCYVNRTVVRAFIRQECPDEVELVNN